MTALGRAIAERPWRFVAAWALALLVALPVAGRVQDQAGNGGYDVPGSGSDRVRTTQARLFDREGSQISVVVPADPRQAEQLRQDTRAVSAALRRDDDVAAVGAPQVSSNGRSALIPVRVALDLEAAQRAVPAIDRRVRAAVGPGAKVVGQAAVFRASTDVAKSDLQRAESIALPVTLALLAVAFLSVVAAGVPIVLALVSLVVTMGLLWAAGQFVDTNAYVTNIAILLGLGLSIDYSLFLVTTVRRLKAAGATERAAIVRAVATTGRAILFSGLTVALSLASLLLVGVGLFSSMAIGATVSAVVATAVAITLCPAVLRLLGPRVERLTIERAARAARRATVWRRLAGLVLRRRVAVAASSAALLLVLCLPALDLTVGFPDTDSVLAGSDQLAEATERTRRDFGEGSVAPLEVVTRSDAALVRSALAADPGVVATRPPVAGAEGWATVVALPRNRENTAAARATVERLRGALDGRFPETFVGGQTAQGVDLADRVADRFPLVVAVAAATSLILLLFAFRSILIPMKSVVTNLLTVGAGLGLLVVLFQWIGGADSIAHFVPLLLFAVLFGLSMDYEVFLLSRIRDAHLAGVDTDGAIATGMTETARPITLAALVMSTVFLAGAASQLPPFQQFGVGVTLVVLLDATVARCLLVPSVVALLGERNWWLPRWGRARPEPEPLRTPANREKGGVRAPYR